MSKYKKPFRYEKKDGKEFIIYDANNKSLALIKREEIAVKIVEKLNSKT